MITKPNQAESIPGKPLPNFLHERFCEALHKRIWAGEKQSEARVAAYRETVYRGDNADDNALKPNTRRLCQRPEVKRRLSELAEKSATLAGIDAGWALLKLKQLTDDIDGFNLDDFLSPADVTGSRYYDLSKVPADKLRLLSELTIEDEITTVPGDDEDSEDETRRIRKIKLKGPAKADLVGPIALMARIAGWEAPKKLAATDKDGANLSFADIVADAMTLVEERRRAKAKVGA